MMKVLTRKKWFLCILASLVFCSIIAFSSLSVGSKLYTPGYIFNLFISGRINNLTDHIILLHIRLPRIILSIIVGGALSVAGGAFQTILKNPLAGPYVTGISGGAAFGVIIASLSGLSSVQGGIFIVHLLAFAGAMLVAYGVHRLSKVKGDNPPDTIILTGVVINAIIFSIILFLFAIMNSHDLYNIFYWLLGYLTSPDYISLSIVIILTAGGFIFIILQTPYINILGLGDDTARSLGVNVSVIRRRLIIAGSILVAASVAICGPIGFIGIIVPHIVRLLTGHDYRLLIPVAFIGGGSFLLIADTISRTMIAPAEIPVGIITSIVGGIFFLYLLKRRNMKNAGI